MDLRLDYETAFKISKQGSLAINPLFRKFSSLFYSIKAIKNNDERRRRSYMSTSLMVALTKKWGRSQKAVSADCVYIRPGRVILNTIPDVPSAARPNTAAMLPLTISLFLNCPVYRAVQIQATWRRKNRPPRWSLAQNVRH